MINGQPAQSNEISQDPVQKRPVKIKLSHYWPKWGGANCATFVNGECISRMASGRKWQNYKNEACACPSKFPFGTKFEVLGQVWTCWDRGGKIVIEPNGAIWIDMLTPKPPAGYKYGKVVDGFILE